MIISRFTQADTTRDVYIQKVTTLPNTVVPWILLDEWLIPRWWMLSTYLCCTHGSPAAQSLFVRLHLNPGVKRNAAGQCCGSLQGSSCPSWKNPQACPGIWCIIDAAPAVLGWGHCLQSLQLQHLSTAPRENAQGVQIVQAAQSKAQDKC